MGFLKTYTGVSFMPTESKTEDINIIDIAHALSYNCRFGGHCSSFYSVSQHSVHVSEILPEKYKLWGLLHDAAEAYISDIPRPAKQHLPQYYELEDSILKTVAKKFALEWPIPERVMIADNVLLVTEARDLIDINAETDWGYDIAPLDNKIEPWSPEKAKAMFLEKFFILRNII